MNNFEFVEFVYWAICDPGLTALSTSLFLSAHHLRELECSLSKTQYSKVFVENKNLFILDTVKIFLLPTATKENCDVD